MNITKLKILNIVNYITLIAFIVSITLQLAFSIINLSFLDFLLVSLFIAISISLISKSLLFNSDNALWFGLLLLIYAGLQVYFKFYPVGIVYKWFWYMFAVVVCSLVVGIIFKERFPFRLASIATFISLILYLHAVFSFNVFVFIALLLVSIIFGYFFQRFIPHYTKKHKH